MGLEMANVVVPTRRTFHSFGAGLLFSADMNPPLFYWLANRFHYTGCSEKGHWAACYPAVEIRHPRARPPLGSKTDSPLLDSHPATSGPGVRLGWRRMCPGAQAARPYLAASIEATSIVSPVNVPVIFTFFPAKASGFFWSLS